MQAIFLKLLNMSITASWLVFAVILFRVLFKRAPKYLRVVLWALVGIRLVFPFSIESVVSLIPSAETVPVEILDTGVPAIQTGIPVVNTVINNQLNEMANAFAEGTISSDAGAVSDPGINRGNDLAANLVQVITRWAAIGWLVGMAAMLLYTSVSYLRITRRVREAVPAEDDIWLCDHISTPFILGVFRPRIYLPSTMAERDIEYVMAHERAHLTRRDHWWKPLGFLLLTVYWFNPVMWIAYVLLCRDIELACDERVIREMGVESKKSYSDALINCSVPRKKIAACPLAFGEVGVKNRIKSVLNYKKPGFWVMVAAVSVSVMVAVCFLTDPSGNNLDAKLQVFIDCEIASHNQSEKSGDYFCCLDWEVLGTEASGSETTVYLWTLYREYSNDNGLKVESGSHVPVAITVDYDGHSYELVEYWTPRDGSYYADDIRAKFPAYLWGKALDSLRYIDEQSAACDRLAEAHFGLIDAEHTVSVPGESEPYTYNQTGEVEIYEYTGLNSEPAPYLALDRSNGRFRFIFSGFSAYYTWGNYSENWGKLTLYSDDGEGKYVFRYSEGAYIFDADASSEIPAYRYTGEAYVAESPVPDGAVFEGKTLDDPVLENPPELTVSTAGENVCAIKGTISWNYDKGGGMWAGYEACGSGMLENADHLNELDLRDRESLSSPEAWLEFEIEPDRVTAVCWNLDEENPESEEAAVDGLMLELKDGNYVYAITARWSSYEHFNGSAEYGFCTRKVSQGSAGGN